MTASQAQGSTSPVDVAAFIEAQPVGAFQIRLLLTCAAVLFLDGFDTQALCYVPHDSRVLRAVAQEYVVSEGRIAHLENSRDFMVAWTSTYRHL